ncbi:MAG TPA: DUF3604 domain-containing protein [Candidatus Limnocylindrales bacterium]|nr:DUF3604 domain-containing protein [Candidatus Limnocylindrales bacterium]
MKRSLSPASIASFLQSDRWFAARVGMLLAACAMLATASLAHAGGVMPQQDWERTEVRQSCDEYNPLRNPYFGDLHVHTAYSADAVLIRTRNGPRDAYAFARGATVGLPPYDASDLPTRTATIDRPLDFTAVTDHAEGFGEAQICLHPGYPGYDDQICADLRNTFDNDFVPAPLPPQAFYNFFNPLNVEDPDRFALCGAGGADCAAEAAVVWQDTLAAAEEHYDRTSACEFTTFAAYEWSSNLDGNNLHRNVIFRNAEVPPLPITYYEEWTPEGLWEALRTQCLDEDGNCDVLAIPHNSNLARDMMFPRNMTDGSSMTAEYAATRKAMEPLVEIIQNKGDAECRQGVGGATDEECGFEKLSRSTLFGTSNWNQNFEDRAYVRFALKDGMIKQKTLGSNPFQLGFIGGTDTHNGTPGLVDESDYPASGHMGITESEPRFILNHNPPGKIEGSGGGLSVLWAEENSRDALFAAMRRRETYATSGTRPIVRVFAGRFAETLCDDPDFVAEGYDKGVPMGGEIGPMLGKSDMRIAVLAQKDPGLPGDPGTPLQRIQIIKGWHGKDGIKEKVYDVAGDAANGAGVDLDTCEPTGTGFDTLCTVWSDPDFDASERAFYYVRVLENPTCRWSTHLCNSLGVDCSAPESVPADYVMCCDEHTPLTLQERALTSPIWYQPELVTLSKGQVRFGEEPGTDRLSLKLFFAKAPSSLDPQAHDLTITLRDEAGVFTATIPAGTMEVKKPGSKYQYKDPTGAIAGITSLSVKIAGNGSAQIGLKTGDIDLAGLEPSAQTLAIDVTSGSYSATDRHEWLQAGTALSFKL